MRYCSYKPMEPATWHCAECGHDFCDAYALESERGDEHRCCDCQAQLESLGSAFTAEPFWERLAETFRYPLTIPVMALIIVLALLSGLLFFIPIVGVVAGLISAGILTKYSFQCLEETATGRMTPPELSEAFSGGLIIILKMIGLLILVGIAGGASYEYLGAGITGFLGALVVLSIPAFLINYAMTDSILASASPLNIFRVVTAIGFPYGILIGLLLLMTSSVNVLSYLVISGWEWSSLVLQSVISNFYMIVTFHLLGYVVFQYQEKLGFYARVQVDGATAIRPAIDRSRVQISAAVKSGQYDKALTIFQKNLDQYNQGTALYDEYFDFLIATANKEVLDSFASDYLDYKQSLGQDVQLKRIHKQTLSLLPDFMPADHNMRFTLARDYAKYGEFPMAVRLINGMHKETEDKALLIKAYGLMQECLDALGRHDMSASCQKFLQRLQGESTTG